MGGVVSKLIHRNSTIPVSATDYFTTYVDGQTSVDIHVVQGERELTKDNRSLARFQLKGIPPLPAGIPKLEVQFIIDANGILSVKALEQRTGTSASITVNPTYGLTDNEVERMLTEAFEFAETDYEARFLSEAKVEAESLIRATQKSLERGQDLLEPGEKESIETCIRELRSVAANTERKPIQAAIEKLNHMTRPLAERIMNQAVSEALRHKTVPSIGEGE
jgi:molecular chaperone DnaK (HSP70)